MTSNERRKLAAQKHNAELDARRKRQEEREQQLAKIRAAADSDGKRRIVIGHHSRTAMAYTAMAAMLACQVEEPPKLSVGNFHQAQQRIRRGKK